MGLNVNDVSVLFPLVTTRDVTPDGVFFDSRGPDELKSGLLTMESKDSAGSEILSSAQFTSLMKFVADADPNRPLLLIEQGKPTQVKPDVPPIGLINVPEVTDRSLWRMVAFRFDPCAPGEHPTITCVRQFRLVFQPISISARRWIESDMGVHLVYNLDEATAQKTAEALLAIKTPETTGVPLGMHPVMFREGLNGPTAEKFRTLVRDTVRPDRLRAIATLMFATEQNQTVQSDAHIRWFFHGALVKDGAILPMAQKIGGQKVAHQSFAFPDPFSHVSPKPDANSLSSISTEDVRWDASASRYVLRGGADPAVPVTPDFEKMAGVDNPHIGMLIVENQDLQDASGGPSNVDCVSCHRTTNHFYRSADPFSVEFKGSAFAKSYLDAKAQFKGVAGVTPVADRDLLQGNESPGAKGWKARNFSYFSGAPSLSLRTLNETILAANHTNAHFLKRPNPWTKACDQRAVMACYYVEKKEFDACVASCAPFTP